MFEINNPTKFEFYTMTDVFYDTLQKKDSEHCMSIV